MATKKKTTRKKTVKRVRASSKSSTRASRKLAKEVCKRPNIIQVLFVLFIAFILLYFSLGIIMGNSNGSDLFDRLPEMAQPSSNSYQCQINAECFTVWCEDNEAAKTCVNTEKMERYYEVCGNFNDVKIKTDYSACSCVEGYCK